jgi:hypothetical protein
MLENENDQSVTAHPSYTKSLEISCAAFLGNDDENYATQPPPHTGTIRVR